MNDNYIFPTRKQKIIWAIITIVIIVTRAWLWNVLADNQSSTDTIQQMNNQLTVIEKNMMENSRFWNGFDEENKAMQKNIDDNKKLMEYHEWENAKLRAEKEKLIAEKEAKLLWK